MTVLHALLLLVAVQRLLELALAGRNARRLFARGAVEVGAGHYRWLVALHTGWLVAMALGIPADTTPHTPLLAIFALLMAARLWIIAALGPYWTTRIVTLPGAPLVRRGPYRLLRHPNYAVVTAEIAVLPLAFGAAGIAVVFTVLNALLLAWRVRIEERALAGRPTQG